MAAITVTDLTSGDVAGTGVFDQLMRATKAHLAEEYSKSRIKGSEYATVYLGAMQSVMSQSLQYLLQEQRTDLEAQLLQEQIETENLNQLQVTQQTANLVSQQDQIEAQTAQIHAQTALTEQQKANMVAEALNIPKQGILLDKQADQVTSEIARSDAQKTQIEQQTSNLVAEALNIPKQGILLDKQADQTTAEIARIGAQENLITEQVASEVKQNELNGILDQQKAQLMAQTDQTEQQTANLSAEALNIPKQGLMLDAQTAVQKQQEINLGAEKFQIESQTGLTDQQTANAITENTILVAQECKTRAEFDLLMEQKLKTISETALLNQKKATEKAQISGAGVEVDSVIGKQKAVNAAQAEGFNQDARQKGAKLMVDTWNVAQTTTGNVDPGPYGLDPTNVQRAVNALLAGIEST